MKPTVLIVENSKFMRERLKLVLQDAGCQVVGEAPNGAAGVEAFKNLRPDLVTMDIVMPKESGLDGFGAMKRILDLDDKAKVVMVSAIDQRRRIDECLAEGAAGYLIKPLDVEMVKKVVKDLMVHANERTPSASLRSV